MSKGHLHSHVHCSIIHNNQEMKTTCVHKWIKKIWCIYEKYSLLNKKRALSFVTAWTNLEDIVPSTEWKNIIWFYWYIKPKESYRNWE
jgi:hypothetical protein